MRYPGPTLVPYTTLFRSCGKPKSDLAHKQAIGRGRNRNKMDHYGHEVLALCRNHHTEQHQIGINSFNRKYHLENRSEEHTSELQSRGHLVCRLLLEKKKK